MKSSIFIISFCAFLLNVLFINSAHAQKSKSLFCFPEASFAGIKTDKNLVDYFEYQICNSSKKPIMGIVFSYNAFYKKSPNKEIFRVKTLVSPNVRNKVKVYLPYKYEGCNSYDIEISKFIYSDGTSKEAISMGNI